MRERDHLTICPNQTDTSEVNPLAMLLLGAFVWLGGLMMVVMGWWWWWWKSGWLLW